MVIALAVALAPVAEAHPVVASLSVDDASPDVNQVVYFDASASTGDGLSYDFDFGDGAKTGWQDSPFAEHAYAEPGTWIATVVVCDQWGQIDTASVIIEVRLPPPDLAPVAGLTDPSDPRVGDTLQVIVAVRNLGAGTADEAVLDIVDVRPGGAEVLVDTMALPGPIEPEAVVMVASSPLRAEESGLHTMRIVVRDVVPEEDVTDNNVLEIGVEVAAAPPPIAKLAVDDLTPFVGETVTFDASASEGRDLEYRFDFGDGSAEDWQTLPVARHAYVEAGPRTATLTVRDADGATDDDSLALEVRSTPPPTGDPPDLAPTGAQPHPRDPRVDEPVVLAIAIVNRGGTAATEASVDVFDAPPSGPATLLETLTLAAPLEVDSTTVLLTGAFQLGEAGTHTLRIVVRDVVPTEQFTNDNVLEIQLVVAPAEEPLPVAALAVDDLRPFVGEPVRFDASASTGRDLVYRFDFGDGNVTGWRTSPFSEHAYAEAGAKAATVTVRDVQGLEAAASLLLQVRPLPPPPVRPPDLAVVAALPDPREPHVGEAVTLAIVVVNRGGTAATSASIDIFDEGPSGDEALATTIDWSGSLAPADAIVIASEPFLAVEEGRHSIRIIVRDVVPAEESSNGNVLEISLDIGPPIPVTPNDVGSPWLVPLLIALLVLLAIVILLARRRPTEPVPLEPPAPAPPDDSLPPMWPPA